jgi:hypothetical protein
MTERAQKVIEATMDLSLRPRQGDRAKVIAAALREVVNQLQYYNFGEGEDMILDARAILELCEELEK